MHDAEWLVEGGQWATHAEQSAAARRLLDRLMGCEVAVEHTAAGAPYLPQHPEVHVSISHCRSAVAVAVSRSGPVGIDVECRRRIAADLAQRVCTADEQQQLAQAADADMLFLRFWTRKEAVLKCRGTGIKGFGSMVEASEATDCQVSDLDCAVADTVGAIAERIGKN